MTIEFWRSGGPGDLNPGPLAAVVESQGWDGQMFMDSQSLSADPYVLMGHWAATTTRLRLSPGVTNPVTRHPAVTAASIATLQAISGGRAVLGIGRGDSALAYLGHAPTAFARFADTLGRLQQLLSGESVEFRDDPLAGGIGSSASLELGDRPEAASLEWLPPHLPKVPLDVASTGPRVIRLAARVAERVTFSVGADPERVRWALQVAEESRRAAGVARPSYGMQVIVVCHREPETVRHAATNLTMPLARFQVIEGGGAAGPRSASDDADYAAIRRGYAMTRHSRFDEEKLIGESVGFDFVQRFAVFGTPDECAERLIELMRIGISRFVVVGPGFYDDGHGGSLFAAEVLPVVRQASAGIV